MNARHGRADGLQPDGGAAAWPAVRTPGCALERGCCDRAQPQWTVGSEAVPESGKLLLFRQGALVSSVLHFLPAACITPRDRGCCAE